MHLAHRVAVVHWRGRDISTSMLALVASLAALALLGLSARVPGWLGRDAGLSNVPPGLLTVAADAKGVATLGGGVSVSMYSDGMRVYRGDDLLLQTVIGGSVLSAVLGATSGSGNSTREHVRHHVDNVEIDELVFLPGRATYLGRVHDAGHSYPLTLRVELGGSVIRIGASVPGADGLVFHLDHEPATTGIRPALPGRNLRKQAYWISSGTLEGAAAFSTVLGTDVGAAPQTVARGVDLRQPGRTDVHVWTDAGYLTVSSQARPPGGATR
jgi:hypothetical protein